MRHPGEVQLAQYASGDLRFLDRWRIGRHVTECAHCASEVEAFRALSADLREQSGELPKDLNWNQFAGEMTGNIRVGLAAGEAIARFDRPGLTKPVRLGWNAAMVLAGATAVCATALWFSLPQQQADHLLAALKRIRGERIGMLVQRPLLAQEGAVVEASSSVLEVKQNGRTLSLLHPHSDGVTVSVSLNGSAGVRYVDVDSGQVTTNKVYYAEQ
jgi:hypothetical protein